MSAALATRDRRCGARRGPEATDELRRDETAELRPGAPDVRSDSPIEPVSAVDLSAQVVPAHLLDGGELVLFALKPSLWFIPMVSGSWVLGALLLWLAASYAPVSRFSLPLMQFAVLLAVGRLAWATLQWSTRLYILTNRRIMRIRGVFNVDVFECPLTRIQNTWLTLSLAERILRIGTIHASTAAETGGGVAWRMVARPLEIHEKLREAIHRAQKRGNHGL